ncbi:metal ABC transporter substrate-binding protein [Citricoccus sp.]|uniref:metal ABC transporter substrate-binding protein n=1 Tax=Citricoccus sp. TaxID=1978372 RepID=UPI002B8E31F1|nr:metal ABC transporter substrate-binding protein [Citricoccus sp.]HRO93551.1 metal ABC transporter substrate-binding protein [Citricoccus sp.]
MPDSPRPGRRARPLPTVAGVSGLAVVALLTLTSCAGGGPGGAGGTDQETATGGEPVAVATTTQLGSVLADITACAGTSSRTLMGPGDDPHDFAPSSQQIAEMTRTGLVVANGLGLESGMQAALDNAAADGATLLEVGPQLDPLPYASEEDAHAEEEGEAHAGEDADAHGAQDPHVWMDVSRMATAAGVIGDELARTTGDERYADCGQETAETLGAADAEVREVLEAIPADRRTLVTDHAAYAYFADAYGFEIAGVVIPGGATDAEPSSERLAQLVAQIEDQGADALVMSAGSGNKLIPALSAETGGEVPVVEVYEGGVGPQGSGAEDYADAMVATARALADALA